MGRVRLGSELGLGWPRVRARVRVRVGLELGLGLGVGHHVPRERDVRTRIEGHYVDHHRATRLFRIRVLGPC